MVPASQQDILRQFQAIPGVGKAISKDLWNLGYRSLVDLRGEDPQTMYDRLCLLQGQKVDRCMLYVFRLAVYFVSEKKHDPKLLLWWNWKNRESIAS